MNLRSLFDHFTEKMWGYGLKLLGYLLLGLLVWGGIALYQTYRRSTANWKTATLYFHDGRPSYTGEFATEGDSIWEEEICDKTITRRSGKALQTRCVRWHYSYRNREGQEFRIDEVSSYQIHNP